MNHRKTFCFLNVRQILTKLRAGITQRFAAFRQLRHFFCFKPLQMKKTLAALSVLGAFAGSSLAADVTLYGVIDTGLVYQHADADLPDVDTVDTFQMKSGVTGSPFTFLR